MTASSPAGFSQGLQSPGVQPTGPGSGPHEPQTSGGDLSSTDSVLSTLPEVQRPCSEDICTRDVLGKGTLLCPRFPGRSPTVALFLWWLSLVVPGGPGLRLLGGTLQVTLCALLRASTPELTVDPVLRQCILWAGRKGSWVSTKPSPLLETACRVLHQREGPQEADC